MARRAKHDWPSNLGAQPGQYTNGLYLSTFRSRSSGSTANATPSPAGAAVATIRQEAVDFAAEIVARCEQLFPRLLISLAMD